MVVMPLWWVWLRVVLYLLFIWLVVYRYLLGFGLLVCFLSLWVLVVMFDYCWLAFV